MRPVAPEIRSRMRRYLRAQTRLLPQKEQTRPGTGDTKSRVGKRTVGLPDPLIALFRTHRQKQEAERQIARQLWPDEGWVFARPDGRPLNPNTACHEWKALSAVQG